MKTFHHGGRFGDLFYALWTMRELGGGKLILSDFHTPNWSLDDAFTLNTLLLYQDFIEDVDYVKHKDLPAVEYNLQEAEGDFNPGAFPECPEAKDQWPGNINIAKRYALHFGLTYRPGETWLTAPNTYRGPYCPIVVHIPERRLIRNIDEWSLIFFGLRRFPFTVIGEEFKGDWLATSAEINSSKIFVGAVSGPHALAEGLGKTRFVEQAPGCFNVSVLPPSQCINGWPNEKVVEEIKKCL